MYFYLEKWKRTEEAQERKKLERHNKDNEMMQRKSSDETREQYKWMYNF